MALHPVKLPKGAGDLYRVVAMQRLLLKALCAEPMDATLIDKDWLQGVWKTQDEDWIKKFCRKRKYSILDPIRAIAGSSLIARLSIYDEFCRQNRVRRSFNSGGRFHEVRNLSGVTTQLATEVHRIFIRFYQFLSHETAAGWNGYEFSRGRCITNERYRSALEDSNRAAITVCPYCDGANDDPELDHYYAKEAFPFLSCSPWNLVPACHLCNKLSAKGSRLALNTEATHPTADWLHPFFRPASFQAQIKLSGSHRNSIPQLYSPDPTEQTRLNNHSALIRTLEKRWSRVAAAYYDVLVRQVNQRLNAANSVVSLVRKRLEDHMECRGLSPSSMVHAAVCQAFLDGRPGYLEEFSSPNAPALA